MWALLSVGLCVGLGWVAYRMEPHWVSKDGERFLCAGQMMNTFGDPLSRWRETRVTLLTAGQVRVDQKKLFGRSTSFWQVQHRSPEPPRGKAVFVLRGSTDDGTPALLTLRMPARSRAVATLTHHIASPSQPRTSQP